jgi:ABC-type spermidine/putrescine transport system permease subunit II
LKKQLLCCIIDAFADGVTSTRMLTRIFLPVAGPALIEATLFAFMVHYSFETRNARHQRRH